ncbi:MAG: ATP-binding protein [Actinomycetota bacterium]
MGIRDRIATPELLGRSAVVGLTAFLVLGVAGTAVLLRSGTDRMIFLVFGAALLLAYAALLPRMVRAARAMEGHNARLQEAEAKYRSLVDQIPAIVYLAEFGPEGDWVYVSAEIEPMLGYSPDEWMAHPHPFSSHLHPDDKQRVIEAEEGSRAEGHVYHAEYRMYRRDGEVLWIRDDAFPVRDAEGRPLFIQGIMYDITDRKAAEDELSNLLAKEREAAARLRAVDEMKNTFLQAVSHELRTPLTQVLGTALTLQNKDLHLTKQQEDDFLDGLVRAARKLDALLSDLLDVDRLGRGIVKPKRRLIDVGSFVGELVETSEVREARTVNVDAPPLQAEVDPSKIERIVENLLSNVVRHTPPGTPVWVSVRAQQTSGAEGVLISVEDAGAGIPTELRENVFEPFRQGQDTSSHSPGMGLGLSLVARFAELHGGRAWVEERKGGGAAFRVFLAGSDEPERVTPTLGPLRATNGELSRSPEVAPRAEDRAAAGAVTADPD